MTPVETVSYGDGDNLQLEVRRYPNGHNTYWLYVGFSVLEIDIDKMHRLIDLFSIVLEDEEGLDDE